MTTAAELELLRDALADLRRKLRTQYKTTAKQVTAQPIRALAADLANRWLTDLSTRPEVKGALVPDVFADYTVAFQMLLRFSEQAATRGRYEAAIKEIVDDFGNRVLVPVGQRRQVAPAALPPTHGTANRIFVGHSFAPDDKAFVDALIQLLTTAGLNVSTGEAPQEGRISDKVKARIEAADVFLGVFTRGVRLTGKKTFSTSAWVVDEKAYAYAKGKRLLLLKEQGVDTIGGIQGDYEYVEFERTSAAPALVKLLSFFNIQASGLK